MSVSTRLTQAQSSTNHNEVIVLPPPNLYGIFPLTVVLTIQRFEKEIPIPELSFRTCPESGKYPDSRGLAVALNKDRSESDGDVGY